jgi:hypothetical protein
VQELEQQDFIPICVQDLLEKERDRRTPLGHKILSC